MSDFKFDIKLKPKKVGEFDVGNPTAWTLLIKPQYKDDTLFVHLHCLFKEPLSDKDKANGVETSPPLIEITKGFMKEGKFILEDKKIVSGIDEASVLPKYEILIKSLLDDGFIKHGEMYLGRKDPDVPAYNVNKRGGTGMGFDLAKMMSNLRMPQNPGVSLTTIPKKNPILRMKAQKFSTVKPQASTSVGNQQNP